MHHWLHALENPYPNKTLISIAFHPVDGITFIFGITRTTLSTNQLRWEVRKKVRFVSETEEALSPFEPEAYIRMDMGEVISVSPVLDYTHEHWRMKKLISS